MVRNLKKQCFSKNLGILNKEFVKKNVNGMCNMCIFVEKFRFQEKMKNL